MPNESVPAAPPQAPTPRILSASELSAFEPSPTETLLTPILSAKSLALLYGPSGSGKSFIALGIAWAAASGGSFLGWQAPKPCRVCYVDGDMAALDVQQRLGLFGAPPATLSFLLADLNPSGDGIPDLGDLNGQKALVAAWGQWPDLLILDSLSTLVGRRHGGAECWNAIQWFLLHLRRCGIAVLLVHHSNAGGRQRGTSQREDMLDLVLALRRPDDYAPTQGARVEIHYEKARGLHREAVRPIEARLETDGIGDTHWAWRPAGMGELHRVAALLEEGLNPNRIAEKLGISKSKSYRLRERAVELGLAGGKS